MKNHKTKKIFIKIFVPIASILIIFAIVSFAYNYISIDRFVKDNAKEKIIEAFDEVKRQLDDFEKSDAETFALQASESLLNQDNNTRVYVYDDNFKEVALFDNTIYIDKEMTSFLSDLLSNYELEEDVLTTIEFNDREYLANTYVTGNDLKIAEKYFVVVQDLTEKTRLIKESLSNIIAIQVLMLILAVIIVYKIALDLSKPIIKLSDESGRYVVGKGITIDEEVTDIREVESLRDTLYKMQEKIEADDKRKSTIYENVAHDLRTPLVSILGYADGLKSGIIKNKNKACDVIIRTGNQLKEMIENILVLSRFDNETYKSVREEVNVNDLIREQVEMVKLIDSEKKVSFEEKNEVVINTDKKLITRIIQNLLSNAIKYAKSSVVVNLSKNVIKITDDGEGISRKDINNIFRRYYKGEDGHFGIGLAVVKNSVEFLGGTVNVTSKKGQGTTFKITL